MTKRRWIVAALVSIFVVVVVVFVILLLAPGGSVTQANFDRIENGMTLMEVEAIFGGQAEGSIGSHHFWTGADGQHTLVVTIEFDPHEKVVKTTLHKAKLTLLGTILHRLGFSIL